MPLRQLLGRCRQGLPSKPIKQLLSTNVEPLPLKLILEGHFFWSIWEFSGNQRNRFFSAGQFND